MEALTAIFERRSIRKFTGEKIDREKLLTLAKAGMAAPTSRDTRHFRFLIIDDETVTKKLTEGMPYSQMLLTAKHALIVCSDLDIAHGGVETDYWIQDSCAAAQNILLAAAALNLGACWTAAHPRADRVNFVKDTCKLPDNVMPLCVIAVGIPKDSNNPRDKFDPICIHWNKWGETE